MIKRFPGSRNHHRSKGIKVKHVLQVLLLLGVSFWLIYQVKHNHDKKKEFDKNDAKLSVTTQTDQIVKLGRKDLHPGKDEANQNEKHEDEEEDEHIVEDEENKPEHNEQEEGNKHETDKSEDNMHEGRDQEEEENKHEAEEQEEDEIKSEDIEDEEGGGGGGGGGGGDGEIDENDQEKSEADIDHDDEIVDEEKEKEEEGDEKENEDKEDEEKGGLVENHNNHEAREEHYKGDDASSAVAHDTHATSTETETINLENSDVNLEMNITKPENETTYSDESNTGQNDSDLKVTEGEVTDGISSNATAGKETGNDSLSNTTTKTDTDSHLEVSSNLTLVTTEASNNLTGAGAEQNKTVILSESDHAQNTTVNTTIAGEIRNVQTEGLEQSGNRISEEKLPDNDSSVSVKIENEDAAGGESSTQGAGELEKTIRFVASNETENTFRNLDRNVSSDISESDKSKGSTETNETQNTDATENEMFKGGTQTGETDKKSDSSSAGEILDSVEHDAIDSSDTHIHEDVTQGRTDLDTLPDIRNEGDETAAE